MIVTILSVDGENEPDIVALNAVSAALAISKVPWDGPIGAVRVGCVKETGNGGTACIVNPGSEQEFSELDLVVSQTKEKTVMIEASANQISEEILIEAIEKAQSEIAKIIAGIEELTQKTGAEKLPIPQESNLNESVKLIEKSYKEEVQNLIDSGVNKEGSGDETQVLIDKIYDGVKLKDSTTEIDKKTIAAAIEKVMFKLIRDNVLSKNKTPHTTKI